MSTRLQCRRVLLLLLAAVILYGVPAIAGVTGKISGVVTDAESEEPIVGATVRVVGTDLVATTDDEGEYFIINVPSGKYNLSVTHVGFELVTKKEVRVLLDLTTPVDFSVRQMAVQLNNEMVVYAEEPPIQKDLTSSKIIFTSDRLKNIPNIVTVQSVLSNYPGVLMDKNNEMHVRGGRSGQVAYFYDGFSIMDPFVSAPGMRILPSALEELSLTSGGFTAEYGDALSGVVSAVTPEGNSEYRGKMRLYQGATHSYDVYTGEWSGLEFIKNRAAAFSFGGPIPGLDSRKYTFFSAGEYMRDNSELPHNMTISYVGLAKVAIQPIPKLKLLANIKYNESYGDTYEHRDVNNRSYDFNLDGLPSFEKQSYLVGLSGNWNLTDRSILSGSFSRFLTNTIVAPRHLMDTHWSAWPGYSEDSNGVYDGTIHLHNYLNNPDYNNPMEAIGFTTGTDFNPVYRWREAISNSMSLSYLSQITKTNQFKLGLDLTKYDIDWDQKQFYNSNPYGETYASKPTYLSAYFQDKLEYEDFVVNMGIRYDYHNADISYNYTPDELTASYREAKSVSRVSPRLGVSFPISDRSVMHFNYGTYFQTPRYTYLYTNLQGDLSTGYPLLGNPDLAPEQTTAYELGLDHMINDGLRVDLTAYYKDIKDLVTTREALQYAGRTVTKFDNDDYGSVKGFDVALEKLSMGGYVSGSISYSYMIAMGNGSSAMDPYYTYLTSNEDTLAPISEYRLDFDQRHTLTTVLDFRVPADWKGKVFGLSIPGNWGINMVGYYGSGLPYTKTDSLGNRFGERNEGSLPSNYSVDMRFNKDFEIGSKKNLLSFFIEVDNLFNKKNILNVYAHTGLPDDDNRRYTGGLSTNQQELARLDRLYDNDPQNYGPPRTVRTGLEFGF
ncbi:MAG: TonB-dependent receptor [bacterium]|nr:TonB-dependent receptor [bacterium]